MKCKYRYTSTKLEIILSARLIGHVTDNLFKSKISHKEENQITSEREICDTERD